MPRAESKGSSYYNQGYSASSYSDSPSPPAHSSHSSASSSSKKRHVCPTCERGFTTSGHLARHSRVHTGERNHKCPFPGCDTRCSRQDNLQQHYRIHLSPGSRRSSTRTTISRVMSSTSKRSVSASASASDLEPPMSPPALEPARIYTHQSPPPDSPPPLAQATLPATAQLPTSHGHLSARSSLSPDVSGSGYPSSGMPSSFQQSQYSSYRNGGGSGYADQSQSQSSAYSTYGPSSSSASSYSDGGHHAYSNNSTPLPHINTSAISHPNSPSSGSGSSGARRRGQEPGSPASASSHSSPATPGYPVGFHDDGYQQQQQNPSALIGVHPYSTGQQHHYSHHAHQHQPQRYTDSPPPVLAPIAGSERSSYRRGLHSPTISSSAGSYGMPQQGGNDYYPHSINLSGHGHGHGAWKTDLRHKTLSQLVQ